MMYSLKKYNKITKICLLKRYTDLQYVTKIKTKPTTKRTTTKRRTTKTTKTTRIVAQISK